MIAITTQKVRWQFNKHITAENDNYYYDEVSGPYQQRLAVMQIFTLKYIHLLYFRVPMDRNTNTTQSSPTKLMALVKTVDNITTGWPVVNREYFADETRGGANLRSAGASDHLQHLRLAVLLVGAHDVQLSGLDDDQVSRQIHTHRQSARRH